MSRKRASPSTMCNVKHEQIGNHRSRLFRAPGRVNLIGEHTDYNEGFVLPAAINFSTSILLTPFVDRRLEIFSEQFNQEVFFDLDELSPTVRGDWSDYVIGVAVTLQQAGYHLRGASLRISGDVPIGSGLSSSAALEVATASALCAHSDIHIERTELAKLCRQAENEFVGAQVGIMDQFVSLHGKAKHALLLDCRSLAYKWVPLSDRVKLVVCNTMVKHQLAGGAYNERRTQCAAGVAHLASKLPGITALRDVTLEQLQQHSSDLPEVIYRRCRHVISENARTLQAVVSLEQDDLNTFGKLMDESHRSLRDDYEVSCHELDLMVDLTHEVDGVFGSRMTGGGFGGCTISLVRNEALPEFEKIVGPGYERVTGLKPEIYVCEAADGAGEIIEKG